MWSKLYKIRALCIQLLVKQEILITLLLSGLIDNFFDQLIFFINEKI